MKKFIDSNIIIKAFTENKDKETCRKILYEEFTTNILCLIEAQYGIYTIKNNKDYAANCIKSLFKTNGEIIELNKNLLFESLKLIDKYKLEILDLIHYATALTNNCSEFISYDKDFDSLGIKRTEP